MTKKQPRAALDEVSKAIIEQLQQDGRRSYAAIGKVVGLSEAAVRQRVQRLIDGGVMQVVAVTDPLELGFARQAMVGIRVVGPLEAASSGPTTRIPTMAWRAKPSSSGSVTATTCMTPPSMSRWTRWRTAASERPTTFP